MLSGINKIGCNFEALVSFEVFNNYTKLTIFANLEYLCVS